MGKINYALITFGTTILLNILNRDFDLDSKLENKINNFGDKYLNLNFDKLIQEKDSSKIYLEFEKARDYLRLEGI